jgi:hypothetical protein
MTSCSFGDSLAFGKKLAQDQSKVKNAISAAHAADFVAAQKAKVVPAVTDLYPGKFMLTFHHGRKYDQDDLRAQDCLAEAERSVVLAREEAARHA